MEKSSEEKKELSEQDEEDEMQKDEIKANVIQKIVSNWKSFTPKRHMRKTLKIYEEQQLQEIPGASKKQGTVMHAALTSEVDHEDYQVNGKLMEVGMRVRNHALIHYIAKLAVSNHDNDTFDFSFVQSLLKNGADINAMDKHGQTVFHEVARSWHRDVAEFLLQNGANINQRDKFGRAPLHVSAAVDYVEMVEYLVSRGADVNIQAHGSLQTPIHFAAKNDACKSLKALIAYGVDVNCRDYQERTPLQLAAAMSRTKAARLLIEMGIPAGVYDKDGEMALSLLVLKMPDVAKIALDQFQVEDKINHKKYFFLNYLEGTRVVDGRCAARTPLEAAVASESVKVIMHPVMQRLIVIKWEKFGKRWAWFDFFINIVSAVIWTIMGVTLPLDSSQLYYPQSKTWWRIVLAIMALLLTLHEIIRQVVTTVRTKKSLTRWKNYRETSLERDMPYCHPQWPDEKRFVESEVKRVRDYRWLASHDRWVYVDWATLILIVAAAVSHVVFLTQGTRRTHVIHVRVMCVLLITIWVRILKFVRPFQGTGAFVVSFTKMLGDIFLSLFLVALIFMPYASSFWIVFGGSSPNPAKGYRSFSNVLYQVFKMTVLDNNHDVLPFMQVDPFMARILSCTYIFISFVIVLNLIIAMITDTFKRVFNYAQEHAAIEKAKTILNIEDSLRKKTRNDYWEYIRQNCSPFVVDRLGRPGEYVTRENTGDALKETHGIVVERFGKHFGDGKLSSVEEIVKMSTVISTNYTKSKDMLFDIFQQLRKLETITADIEAKTAVQLANYEWEKHTRAAAPVRNQLEVNSTSSRRKTDKKMRGEDVHSKPPSAALARSSGARTAPHVRESSNDERTPKKHRKSRKDTRSISKSLGNIVEKPRSRRSFVNTEREEFEGEKEAAVRRSRAKSVGYIYKDDVRARKRIKKFLHTQQSPPPATEAKQRNFRQRSRSKFGDTSDDTVDTAPYRRDYDVVIPESDLSDVSLQPYLQNSSASN